MNWHELATTSPFRTARAALQALQRGNVPDASAGIEELVETLARSDKRALRSHLTRLLAHIIKWQTQPEKRSRSWRASIRNARREIASIQEETPSLTRAVIESMWQDCFEAAKEEAEGDMNQESTVSRLSWKAAFEKDYEV